MQQGISEGSEPAATPPRAQPTVETPTEDKQGGEEEGVCVPGEELRAPRPGEGARRPHRGEEALQPEARGEEVEVREVLEEVCSSIGLEGSFQDMWDKGIQM